MRDLKRRMRRKERSGPALFDLSQARRRSRPSASSTSVYTAPHFGFRGRRGLLPPRERDARRSIASACRRSSSRPRTTRSSRREPFRDPKVTGNPHITLRLCRARRPLRLRRAARRRRRRLLGGETDRGIRRARMPDCTGDAAGEAGRSTSRFSRRCPAGAISSRANSGPLPSSSCLKYTNTSRHDAVSRAIVSAQRAMSSGV